MIIFLRFVLLSAKEASCPHRKVARHRVVHDWVSQLRLGASAPHKVPEIDTSVEQNFTQATLKMKGDPTIVERIGAVMSVLVFLQRNKWLANGPLGSPILTRGGFDKFHKVHYVVNAHLRVPNEDNTIQWTKAQKNRSLTNLNILNNHLSGELTAFFIMSITGN